jgi:hypothetical protein
VIDQHGSCGDGVRWSIRLSDRGPSLAAGVVHNGGSAIANATGYPALRAIEVEPGDLIELKIAPRATHMCDSTLIRLVITLRPGA